MEKKNPFYAVGISFLFRPNCSKPCDCLTDLIIVSLRIIDKIVLSLRVENDKEWFRTTQIC